MVKGEGGGAVKTKWSFRVNSQKPQTTLFEQSSEVANDSNSFLKLYVGLMRRTILFHIVELMLRLSPVQ